MKIEDVKLGMSVRIGPNSEFYEDWKDDELIVHGLVYEDDNETVRVHLRDSEDGVCEWELGEVILANAPHQTEKSPRYKYTKTHGNYYVADSAGGHVLCMCSRETDAMKISDSLNKQEGNNG